MAGKKNVTLGKFISKILRHEPGLIGIRVDEHGWADVEELIAGIQAAGHPGFDMAALEEIVETNNKQRYSFSSDKRLIRANQGHSIPVDVEPDRFVPSIMEKGILRMSRLYVHLSPDEETARIVGRRHGKPVILRVDAGQMEADGYVFYLSANGVWLTTEVPVKYITVEKNRD